MKKIADFLQKSFKRQALTSFYLDEIKKPVLKIIKKHDAFLIDEGNELVIYKDNPTKAIVYITPLGGITLGKEHSKYKKLIDEITKVMRDFQQKEYNKILEVVHAWITRILSNSKIKYKLIEKTNVLLYKFNNKALIEFMIDPKNDDATFTISSSPQKRQMISKSVGEQRYIHDVVTKNLKKAIEEGYFYE